jgi:hypothetical protein
MSAHEEKDGKKIYGKMSPFCASNRLSLLIVIHIYHENYNQLEAQVKKKNAEMNIIKDRESKDPGQEFWDNVTLCPEQAVKHQCPKCVADHQKYLATSDKSDFKFQCNFHCFWFDRFAGLREVMK